MDPSTFLANFWNLSLKSENLELFFPQKIWQICVIFSIKNPLDRSKSYFSG